MLVPYRWLCCCRFLKLRQYERCPLMAINRLKYKTVLHTVSYDRVCFCRRAESSWTSDGNKSAKSSPRPRPGQYSIAFIVITIIIFTLRDAVARRLLLSKRRPSAMFQWHTYVKNTSHYTRFVPETVIGVSYIIFRWLPSNDNVRYRRLKTLNSFSMFSKHRVPVRQTLQHLRWCDR